jgi:pre-mRNA-splicing factor RBM22/SLT11
LQFGLPIVIRDKALELVAPGPTSEINREYFAQNNELAIEEGRAGVEEYEKADAKGRELLRRLAHSKPYFKKGRLVDEEGNPTGDAGPGGGMGRSGNAAVGAGVAGPGPIRTRDSRAASAAGRKPGFRKGAFPSTTQLPPGPSDYIPPEDQNIMSLFVTGVEDDLPEYKIREFFKVHGKIKSLVCSHMSHCAFVNYETREAAEAAAAACQGRAVIAGCPLRVRWGQPKPIGLMNKEERLEMIRDGRSAFPNARRRDGQKVLGNGEGQGHGQGHAQGDATDAVDSQDGLAAMPPPGAADVKYASLSGN